MSVMTWKMNGDEWNDVNGQKAEYHKAYETMTGNSNQPSDCS